MGSNQGGVYTWQTAAAANATADSTINWSAGMAPSSVSPSGRSMMASVAKYRDDISGAIVTGSGGTSTAYIVSSNQLFDSATDMHLKTIAFTPNVTNTAGSPSVTLTVDGFAGPLRLAPNVDLPSGTIIQGTPYVAIYNNTDTAFYLQGGFVNPYNIPLGAGIDYWGPTAPNSSFAFPIGQAISRTTFATLFALVGTRYGTGDGTTTFNLPNRNGRVSAQLDPSGTILTSATMTPDGNTLGAKGGTQQSTLTTANLPAYTPSGALSNASATIFVGGLSVSPGSVNLYLPNGSGGPQTIPVAGTFTGNPQGGTSVPFTNMSPVIACNYILRIL